MSKRRKPSMAELVRRERQKAHGRRDYYDPSTRPAPRRAVTTEGVGRAVRRSREASK